MPQWPHTCSAARRRTANSLPAGNFSAKITVTHWKYAIRSYRAGNFCQGILHWSRESFAWSREFSGLPGRRIVKLVIQHKWIETALLSIPAARQPAYSITSSARCKIDCGTVRPNALAVFRLMGLRCGWHEITSSLPLRNGDCPVVDTKSPTGIRPQQSARRCQCHSGVITAPQFHARPWLAGVGREAKAYISRYYWPSAFVRRLLHSRLSAFSGAAIRGRTP